MHNIKKLKNIHKSILLYLNTILTIIFLGGIITTNISADSFTETTITQANMAHQKQEERTLDSPNKSKELRNQIKGIQNLLVNKYNYTQYIAKKIITEDVIRGICSQLYNGGLCEGDTPTDILDIGKEEINLLLIAETNTKIEMIQEENTLTNEIPIKITFESKRQRNPFGDGIFISNIITNNYMTITSIVDDVNIDNIIINKGNCSLSKKQSSIHNLKYGEFKKILLPSKCRVIRVNITTNKGSWVFDKN